MPQHTVAFLYKLWLAALLLKALGAAWDISWHFRSIRDVIYLPPHLLNFTGDLLAIAGIIFHTYTGYGVDKAGLRLMQWGMGIFLVAAPLDELNHQINGLDITTWSPSHFLLFLGTAIMIAGVIRGAHTQLVAGRFQAFTLFSGFYFFFDNTLFPNGHQEYGVVEIASWDAGRPEGDANLLQFAAEQAGQPLSREVVVHFALPIPAWFYPVWGILAGALVLLVARKAIGWRWSATAIVLSYLAFRTTMWIILNATGFTRSAVPFWLLLMGIGLDVTCLLATRWTVRAIVGGIVITTLSYAGIYLQASILVAPPIEYWSAPFVAVALIALWALGETAMPRYHLAFLSHIDKKPNPATVSGE